MAHRSRLYKVVVDVPDTEHDREMAFWGAAVGRDFALLAHHPEYHAALLPGERFGMLVQRMGDGPARVHLDIHTDDVAAEVARLERLGATRVRQVHSWWVMRDPAGLLFCVIPDTTGALTDENSQRWD